ncbi:helix-turn-helix transcriptional regulator [Saccharopolyspora sp. NFXS83]|uniref:helix-turn-helix domain-containing protein n=1 Tax=Saccharopolyspora sp. NFXS83 TaxID=2993560 RepID=UPI00224B544C|nr:helix-turn-helix transcriptional regulator [Saccharopolyspora sp. NFXS83]MCX2733081.1 helix-turn-helix transcriptional regulator [Saccharopolyspora sp. NFXS83]
MRQRSKVRQMGLGADLRKAREQCRMSTRSVAERIGVSHTSVARTELGTRVPEPEEVIALCAVYGITGRRRDQMVEQVDGTDASTAWLATGPATAQQITSLVALETKASEIIDVSLGLVPGLLQTAEYARAVIGAGGDAEWLLSTRLARQALLTRPEAPLVRFLIDEFALRRVIGDSTVMRHQLDHLIRMQERSQVRIQVVPRYAGVHAGLDGAFVVLTFPEREPHVYVEARRVGLFLTRPQDVEPFIEGVEDLEVKALCEARSAELIGQIGEELEDD